MVWGMHWSSFLAWVIGLGCIVFSLLYFWLAKKEEEDR